MGFGSLHIDPNKEHMWERLPYAYGACAVCGEKIDHEIHGLYGVFKHIDEGQGVSNWPVWMVIPLTVGVFYITWCLASLGVLPT